jgi:hypothetical protein
MLQTPIAAKVRIAEQPRSEWMRDSERCQSCIA